MDIKYLPCFVNDADSALADEDYNGVERIMEEARPLIIKAETAAKKLAGAIHTWSLCIADEGVTAETEIYVGYIRDNSAELQNAAALLLEIHGFMEALEKNIGYQNWRRQAA